jgi:hypothetical protein
MLYINDKIVCQYNSTGVFECMSLFPTSMLLRSSFETSYVRMCTNKPGVSHHQFFSYLYTTPCFTPSRHYWHKPCRIPILLYSSPYTPALTMTRMYRCTSLSLLCCSCDTQVVCGDACLSFLLSTIGVVVIWLLRI